MSDQPENTPAGSYRVAGNDVSGYLGVDNEYMNYADETQKPSLTEEEQYLFLPAPVDEEDESVEGYGPVTDEEKSAESDDEDAEHKEQRNPEPLPGDFVAPSQSPSPEAETVTLAPTRPAL
jgi:hypothetical protein